MPPWDKYATGDQPADSATPPAAKPWERYKAPEASVKPWEKFAAPQAQRTADNENWLSHSWDQVTKPIREMPGNIKKEFKEGSATVKEAMGEAGEKLKKGEQPGLANTMKAVGGVAGQNFSPVTGAVKSLWTHPAEETLGTKPIEPGEGLTANRAKHLLVDTGENALMTAGPGIAGKMAKVGAKAAGEATKPVADVIKKIFSPSTASPEGGAAAALRREETGIARQQTAQARAQMDQFAKQINAKAPQEQLDFINYVENRSKGSTLSDPALQPVADKLREIYQSRMNELSQLDSTKKMTFIEDYFPHMWKEKQPALQPGTQPGVPRMGSGRNLKARKIPTIADGLARGLTPVTSNLLEATLNYVSNMDRFLAENRIIERGRALGDVKYFTPGNQPQGWVPLEGRLANKTATIPARTKQVAGQNVDIPARARPMKAYAPDGWARVYNNAVDPGFHRWPVGGQVYDALQKIINSTTMMELGLSGFHAYTMAQESMIDDLARSVGQAARGDVKGMAKSMAKTGAGAPTPLSAAIKVKTGSKFLDQYLGLADHGPDYRKVTDLFTRAGGRAEASRQEWQRGTSQLNYWQAWKKGALKSELQNQWQDIKGRPVRGIMTQAASAVSRLMDSVSHPLFDQMIPRLKNGAFFDNMKDWLAAHPAASDAEQLAAARHIVDSIDNRFGELNTDNVFWNKMLKQSFQLMIRAVGWDLGTLREIGGGVKDVGEYIAKGELQGGKTASRIKYIIALPVITMLGNEVWSYLKTGQPTKDPFTFPTGGVNPDGTPERAMVPGYMRDVIGYTHDMPGSIVEEGKAKIASAPRMFGELMTNRDWRDLPIAEMSDWAQQHGAQGPFLSYLNNVYEHYEPLSIRSYQQRKEGSGLSVGETMMGIRRAPMYLGEPEQYKTMMERRRAMLDREKEKSDQRIKDQQKR